MSQSVPKLSRPSGSRKGVACTLPQIVARIWRRSRPSNGFETDADCADETCLGYEASWLQWQWQGTKERDDTNGAQAAPI